ncbi:MAG TPA: hypothetical protein VFS66_12630 [Acidimicrobiia bacterium]|nr:hypothetical protein [Acidimicrobiia bacterium]
MSPLRKTGKDETTVWRVCQECGNRYQAANHGFKVNWCSTKCESTALRRQRDDIESSWIRASWFLR